MYSSLNARGRIALATVIDITRTNTIDSYPRSVSVILRNAATSGRIYTHRYTRFKHSTKLFICVKLMRGGTHTQLYSKNLHVSTYWRKSCKFFYVLIKTIHIFLNSIILRYTYVCIYSMNLYSYSQYIKR